MHEGSEHDELMAPNPPVPSYLNDDGDSKPPAVFVLKKNSEL
jgi:hypothetical protein